MELLGVVDPAAAGAAGAPQRLRNVRARADDSAGGQPQKRRCTEAAGDANETAIAEMLLGLSSSPRSSSPRDSDISTEDEEFLPLSPSRRRGAAGAKGSPARRAGSGALGRAKSAGSPLADEEGDLASQSSGGSPKAAAKAAKKLPGRCKCGKRVSASHPPCKSELMLLCERFCARFGRVGAREGLGSRIHLNECALALGVPRRRLYDITIVFEAVEVVKRTGKLAYVWRGMTGLPALVEQLQREEAERQPVADRKGNAPAPGSAADKQATHSLWALSRKFIRLMLTTKGPIQLSEAAEHLIGEQAPAGKRAQTQITVERRLYDIGSILATLNLIHRTYIEGKRQPAFSWNWDWASEKSPVAVEQQPPPQKQQLHQQLPQQQAMQPLACGLPQQQLPLPLGLSMPLAWSLPQPSMFAGLAQHELLSLPPLPPALAASLLQMPPTLSGCSQDSGNLDWSLPPVLGPLAPLAPMAGLAPAQLLSKAEAACLPQPALQ